MVTAIEVADDSGEHTHFLWGCVMLKIEWFRLRVLALAKVTIAALGAMSIITPGVGLAAVDVNVASAQELRQVKGIGTRTAERIVAERARGAFESLEHLSERLSGIGPKTIVKLKEAGLCAGTVHSPCEKAVALSQASRQGSAPRKSSVTGMATPEIFELP